MAYHHRKRFSAPQFALLLFLAGLAGCGGTPFREAPQAQSAHGAAEAGSEAAAPNQQFALRFSAASTAVDVAAPGTSPKTARPDLALAAKVSAPAQLGPPAADATEIRDALPISRFIDLTAAPDNLWERVKNGFAMPNLTSPEVQDRQIWYASRPSDIRRMVERSKRYLYHIVQELEKRGMPTELALLPMVESAFNPMAYSRAHASGLWQFIPSTGKTYKLQQNWWYDARRDIIASTTAALDYLQFLYDMHGDWHLALASYNWGENAVARAIEKNRSRGLPTDYLSLTMPQETRYYVPKLQALKNIVANPRAFNIGLDPIPNEPYFVTVDIKNIDIKLAAKLAQLPVEELIALNPAHNRPVIYHSDTLVLPADRGEIFQANLENHVSPLVTWHPYTFRKGDRLEKLAAVHGIKLAKLKQANGITARTRVAPGFRLLLPVKGTDAVAEPLPAVFVPPAERAQAHSGRTVVRRSTHTVARGETLTSIAARYKVSVIDLRSWNRIGRLAAGQKLVIEQRVTLPAKAPRTRTQIRKINKSKPPARKSITTKASVARPDAATAGNSARAVRTAG